MGVSTAAVHGWISDAFATLDLGDRRLNARAELMVRDMVDKPEASIPKASGCWAATQGAYRFLSNPSVEPAALRGALADACLARVRQEPAVLVVHDTTSLDFTGHDAMDDLGPLGGGAAGLGLFVHSAIAVSREGIPLGLLHQKDWARDPEKTGSRHVRKQLPLEEKESFKWLETLRAAEALLPPHTAAIHVADREADIFEFIAEPRRANSFVLVRASHQRRIEQEAGHLLTAIAQAPCAGEFEFTLRRGNEQRPPRPVRIAVSYCQVTLRPPSHGVHDPGLQPKSVTAILAQEMDPPNKQVAVSWLLLTDMPVDSFEAARECVGLYTLRWLIERYHYALKSGCQIEDTQLQSADGLRRLLALYCIVALRLLWITYSAREHGEQPCTVAFSEPEWQVLHRYFEPQLPLPETPPTLYQAVRWTARLGGFLNRKGDGEPGIKSLWHGLTRLQDIVLGVMLVKGDVCKG